MMKNTIANEPFPSGSTTLTEVNIKYKLSERPGVWQYVAMFAHPSNNGRIWIGGKNLELETGAYIDPTSMPMLVLPALVLDQIYVIGEAELDKITWLAVGEIFEQ
jgi:hypothetical protein